jgi:hypothetical protein
VVAEIGLIDETSFVLVSDVPPPKNKVKIFEKIKTSIDLEA